MGLKGLFNSAVTDDFLLEIALGNITGFRYVRKFYQSCKEVLSKPGHRYSNQ
jgi:hypothetical protein